MEEQSSLIRGVPTAINTDEPTEITSELRAKLGLSDTDFIPANTYAYSFNGLFTKGGVTVTFQEGKFATLDGAPMKLQTKVLTSSARRAILKF